MEGVDAGTGNAVESVVGRAAIVGDAGSSPPLGEDGEEFGVAHVATLREASITRKMRKKRTFTTLI